MEDDELEHNGEDNLFKRGRLFVSGRGIVSDIQRCKERGCRGQLLHVEGPWSKTPSRFQNATWERGSDEHTCAMKPNAPINRIAIHALRVGVTGRTWNITILEYSS
jgi:hypothetical protein